MGQLRRAAAAAVALVGCVLLGGCGGSVADADRPKPTRTAAPLTPFCAAVRDNTEALRPLTAMATGGPRPENLVAAVDRARRAGTELLRVAPDEIRSDVERTVQAVNLQLDALVANGGDAAAVARDPDLVAKISSPEFSGAGERYRGYVTRTCNPPGDRGTG